MAETMYIGAKAIIIFILIVYSIYSSVSMVTSLDDFFSSLAELRRYNKWYNSSDYDKSYWKGMMNIEQKNIRKSLSEILTHSPGVLLLIFFTGRLVQYVLENS